MNADRRWRGHTMTKAEVTERFRSETGLSWSESAELVDFTLEVVKETLAAGSNVKISGFGSFIVTQKAARRGRNPHTSARILIARRRVLTFKPSSGLRTLLNQPPAAE